MMTDEARAALIDEHVDILERVQQIRIVMRYESWYSVRISKRSVEEILDETQALEGPYRMDVMESPGMGRRYSIDCCDRTTRTWNSIADGSESGESPAERKAWMWLHRKYPQMFRILEIDRLLAGEGVSDGVST